MPELTNTLKREFDEPSPPPSAAPKCPWCGRCPYCGQPFPQMQPYIGLCPPPNTTYPIPSYQINWNK